jgi:glycerate kinase
MTQIAKITPPNSHPLSKVKVICASDVTNPTYGESGAAFVFAPQKGAGAEEVLELDRGLRTLADVVESDLELDLHTLPGGGAAGGLGAGLYAFCGAKLRRGVDIICDAVGLADKIKGADLIITGEGCTDYQTAFGKLPSGVASLAKSAGIPCLLISGAINGDISQLYSKGVVAAYATVTNDVLLDEAIKNAAQNLERTAENAMREWFK